MKKNDKDQTQNSGEANVSLWRENAAMLEKAHAYDPASEHDACGVGLIAAIDGKPRREVVEAGIAALKALWHRGAVDADGKTGDGAGIHVEIAQDFFKEHIARTGHEPRSSRLGVGMVFLPRTDFNLLDRCRSIVESEILNFGYTIYGWRQVPVNVGVIGEKANATRPEIEQIMIASKPGTSAEQFESDLYIIRRRIEKHVLAENINDFYICSFSCRSIIYKGLFLAEQVDQFYPDLLDERFVSSYAIIHQRYSTNTYPNWRLAQPFRTLAHNGEINTLRGNVNWMKSHETRIRSDVLGDHVSDIKPVIQPDSSDSAALDAVFELMVQGGRTAPMAKSLLIPDSWSKKETMDEAHKAFYSYCNCVMEPWDGPAAVAATDGKWVIAGMDRNGLRPMRYTLTRDNLLVVGSEAGMVMIPETDVIEKGRIGPGQMIGVDLVEGRLYRDDEIKDMLSSRQPFEEWSKNIVELNSLFKEQKLASPMYDREELRRHQCAFGYTMEDLEMVLQPMAEDSKEALGSMGDDTPLAVLSEHYRGLHHFFRQNFSQVTNPPIDSLRENYQMSLKTRLGNLGNILDENESQTRLLQLESPVLSNAEFSAMRTHMGGDAVEIDCTFDAGGGDGALREALDRIQLEAENGVREGAIHVVLTDIGVSADRVAIPMILATGAVHSHLVRQKLRTFTSLNVRSGECLDVHYFAVLIGVGATTINAYLAEESLRARHDHNLFPDLAAEDCIAQYKQAVNQGILKVMSKMGISVLSSYRGGANFEAVGLSRALVAEFFPGMTSRISGIGLAGIERKVVTLHATAYNEFAPVLPVGGFYSFRQSGEAHALHGELIHTLQTAVSTDSYTIYRRFSDGCHSGAPVSLRDLLGFKDDRKPISLEEVESITDIRKRLVAPGISLGALSPEAHETLSIAMNRIGAKSDSGEGGEDASRYKPRANGDNASSAIKQVASGRFGVTAEYLNNCRELEIKIAQGAKPGEGGQLPGIKVSEMIARLRHSTPGITLISPPPHHDIYSIEDLAQLIYDLKQINPDAKVCVKLVAQSGIGTIAAGVAKAKADVILVSGHSGGTGASPQSSIKYVGLPWEMGLAEVNQVLTLNQLRHRVKLRTDGGLKTGRDVVIAAMLGAEEYGIGTLALVAMGCIMVRQCQSNTCPVGVCTQNPKLRDKFTGSPEKVVNLMSFIAEEVREILASLGVRSLQEVIGRTDLLTQVSRGSEHLDDLDLNPLLVQADAGDLPRYCASDERNEVPETLDAEMIEDAAPALDGGEKMQLAYNVRNTQRAIGAKLSSAITRRFGMDGLEPGQVTVRLRGTAGQSLGAFAVQGLKLEVFGDANDYTGKGLSGGTIVVRPLASSPITSNENTIIGNTVLYGATAGYLFAAGQAGERFCVRNSGAEAVVEGCGSNGCEYMTGGMAVILGSVGDNFGAGMTGGMAFVYDADGSFEQKLNPESLVWQRVETAYWEKRLKRLVQMHVANTQSRFAERLINAWGRELSKFWQVVPREMLDHLEYPVREESEDTGSERA
ncbi:MAG: glutamate synthase large subunit [Rhodospirillales bacterium]|jgi:glutamate synthase (NADPH) large chain|nr:glutamate synthase large subunit [Rhodospirillales bacterium]MBT4005825.1 glutamate synthase large subunit [Rhodospirillales bacterium]MBT5075608.1 glutamate synthase large subunit [Rhodospirillales bacterium]MBT5114110.1 glutamate synthase large subunit [Rhodospirillales bacterium]MBT5672638.1 glutamate synthase large subunit [Rhodospirillales bacterium]